MKKEYALRALPMLTLSTIVRFKRLQRARAANISFTIAAPRNDKSTLRSYILGTMKTHFILTSIIAAAAHAKTPATKAADYIAHEWGTFTSVQAQDGVQLDWNPFTAPDLPKFVYTVFNPTGRANGVVLPGFTMPGKTAFTARQRMETPVIYFYADKSQTVDVGVTFPEGRITEWYPQLANPKAQAVPSRSVDRNTLGAMRWTGVELLPGDTEAAKLFPNDGTKSHYYPARETDAVPLRVKAPDGTAQHEKLLFYRGIGQFTAPLTVRFWNDDGSNVQIQNAGTEPLAHSFLYIVRGDRAVASDVPALAAGDSHSMDIKFAEISRPLTEVRAELAAKMRAALVSEGLYEKEAAAMVKTWDDSWFGDQGMRVLYTLPQKWSDRVLPLTFSPAPKELKRVFVGRAEMITPAQEWALLREIVRFSEGGSLEKKAAVAATHDIGLGRFTEAAVRRLSVRGPGSQEFTRAAFGLLDATRPARSQGEQPLPTASR